MSRGFPSSESVLLSESLPSCRWTDCCSTALSAARVDELIASGWLFNLPSTKSTRDCRGFPSPESVHLLAVLPVVQGRASRVLSDSNNHLLTSFTHTLRIETPGKPGTPPRRAIVKQRQVGPWSESPPKRLSKPRCTRQSQQYHCGRSDCRTLASQVPSHRTPTVATPELIHRSVIQ